MERKIFSEQPAKIINSVANTGAAILDLYKETRADRHMFRAERLLYAAECDLSNTPLGFSHEPFHFSPNKNTSVSGSHQQENDDTKPQTHTIEIATYGATNQLTKRTLTYKQGFIGKMSVLSAQTMTGDSVNSSFDQTRAMSASEIHKTSKDFYDMVLGIKNGLVPLTQHPTASMLVD